MDCTKMICRYRKSIAFVFEQLSSSKCITVGCAGLISVLIACSASAQLRTGREVRSLYHEKLEAERQIPKMQRRDPGVVQASYSQAADSILENPPAIENHIGSGVVEGSPIYEAGIANGEAVQSGCNCGHGGGYVSGSCGCDGLSTLAPTCASGCGIATCFDPCFGSGPIGTLIRNMSVRAEVPLYWRRAAGPPPLVATGALPGGQVLLGNGPLNDEATAGFRLNLSSPITRDGRYGLLFRYWTAGEQTDTFNFSTADFPTLVRPFLNTTNNAAGVQDTNIIGQNTATNENTGSITVRSHSELDGLNIFLRRLMYRDRFSKVEWLYGYQHLKIGEQLTINSQSTIIRPAINNGQTIAVTDDFATENYFNGVVYGLMGSRDIGRLRFESTVRLGLGNLQRRVNISGSSTTGGVNTTTQGLLARDSNSGLTKDDTFIVLPEVGINAAYQIRPGLDFNVGYNYMLVPKVAQASRQIDKDLAVSFSNTATDPNRDFEERNYWINSLGLGLQWNY